MEAEIPQDLFEFASHALADLRKGDNSRLRTWARSRGADLDNSLPFADRLEDALSTAEVLLEGWRKARTDGDEPRAEVYGKLLEAQLESLAGARTYSFDEVEAQMEAIIRERERTAHDQLESPEIKGPAGKS